MRIAGIDPGTIQTGVGILEDSGKRPVLIFSHTIQAERSKAIADRLETIFTELKAILQEWKPEVLALENVFYQKDFKAAVKVGEARAAAMLAASLSGIPVVEYPPARVKQSVSGNGRAAKEQVQYMVRNILGFRGPLSADSADAIAVAICHIHSKKFAQIEKAAAVHV
ncbi:MAG: crossover junction endodeoxyribonuclease RuvC [Candidatus Omnitrophica bacterium]|nr:crossover junction endodeoxyribonuclease RuvC [Candidatus Omnitrophota bacterium]